MLYLEFDWTFDVYRFRIGASFTDLRGVRSWATMGEAKEALRAAGFRLGKKTDSRTWSIELATQRAAA